MVSRGKQLPKFYDQEDVRDEDDDDGEDYDEEDFQVDDQDEEDIDDELNLPDILNNISLKEKKKLLRFKRTHNEREYEEEIDRRTEPLRKKKQLEQLKNLANVNKDTTTETTSSNKKPTAPARKKKAAAKENSDNDESDNDVKSKKRGTVEVAGSNKKARKVVLSDDESDDGAAMDVEDDKSTGKDDEAEESADGGDDSDDLFGSDEEREISNIHTKDKKPAKKSAKKGGGKSKRDEPSDEEEEEDEDSEDDLDDDSDDNKNRRKTRSASAKKGRGASRLYDSDEEEDDYLRGSDEDGEAGYDYNLQSIKNRHKTNEQINAANKEEAKEGRQRSGKNKGMYMTIGQLEAALEEQKGAALPTQSDDMEKATIEEYRKVTLSRTNIICALREPYFDSLVVGAFIRIPITLPASVVDRLNSANSSNTLELEEGEEKAEDAENKKVIYRLVQIRGIERTNQSYPLPANPRNVKRCQVRLTISFGGAVKERHKLSLVSDRPIEQRELDAYLNKQRSNHENIATKRDLRALRWRHKQLTKFQYSNELINEMLKKNTGINKLLNTEYSTAMESLQKKLAAAREQRKFEEMEELQKTIDILTKESDKQRHLFEKTFKRQIDVNKRMKESNVRRDMAAGMRKRQEDMEAAAKGTVPSAISDPFVRRETRPKILWNTGKAKVAATGDAAAEKQGEVEKAKLASNSVVKKDDESWAMDPSMTLDQVRKRVKAALGVDPYEAMQTSDRNKYLSKVCKGLPPLGSTEREQLRGPNGKSLAEVIHMMTGTA